MGVLCFLSWGRIVVILRGQIFLRLRQEEVILIGQYFALGLLGPLGFLALIFDRVLVVAVEA